MALLCFYFFLENVSRLNFTLPIRSSILFAVFIGQSVEFGASVTHLLFLEVFLFLLDLLRLFI